MGFRVSGRVLFGPIAAGLAAAAFAGAAASWAGAAEAPYVLVVGPTDNYAPLIAGIARGIEAGGFGGAPRVRVDVQNVKSFAQAKKAITAAIDGGADAIVTVFGQATRAAHEATASVPIVFAPVADPVASKYVASADAPGGNLTGVATADVQAIGERLDLFRQVLPAMKRLAVFFDPASSVDKTFLANLEKVAPPRGLTLVPREVADPDHAVATLRALDRSQADAVFFVSDSLLRHAGDEIGRAAVERKLPLLTGEPELELPGMVAAVGPDQEKMGQMAGEMVAKVLKGAKPSSLKVEHPPFDLVVSLKAARDVGASVPDPALASATRILK